MDINAKLSNINNVAKVSIFLLTATETKGNKWEHKTKEGKYSTRH